MAFSRSAAAESIPIFNCFSAREPLLTSALDEDSAFGLGLVSDLISETVFGLFEAPSESETADSFTVFSEAVVFSFVFGAELAASPFT